jgi:hypothetical protein
MNLTLHHFGCEAGVIGIKEVGLVEYRFLPDGVEVRHVRAPGQINVDLDSLLGQASKS